LRGAFVKKRTVTTIEMHQVVIVRRPEGVTLSRCPVCQKDVEMVSLEEASMLAGVDPLDICHRLTEDDVHFTVTEKERLVCLDSLMKKVSLGDTSLNAERADIPLLPAADLNNHSES
jgi:hypothetical protein